MSGILKKRGNSVDAGLLTLVKINTAVLGLICTRLISVNFSYQDYATYSQALLCATTITSIAILGLTDAVNLFFNKIKTKQTQKQIIATIFNLQYVSGLVCGIILVLCAPMLTDYFDNEQLSPALYWVAFVPLMTNLLAMQQVLFICIKKSKVIAVRNLIVSIIRLIIYLVACFVIKDIVSIIILTFICDTLQVIYFKFLLHKYGISFGIRDGSWSYVRKILSFSLPMVAYVLCSSLMRDADKYIIGYFTSTEIFAVYSNASRILPFDLVTASFVTVLLPVLTKSIQSRDYKQSQLVYGNYLNFGLIVIGILVSAAIITAPQLLNLLYGPKYLKGQGVFIVYLLVSLVRFTNFSFIYAAAGNSKAIMKVSIISLLSNILFALLLFHLIGPIGCALSNLTVSFATNIYLMHDGARYIGTNIFKLVDLKSVSMLALASVILYFAYGALKENLNAVSTNWIAFLISYCLLVAMMGFLFQRKIFASLKSIN